MNYETLDYSSWGESLSSGLTYFSLAMIVIIMPLINLYLLIFKSNESLKENELKLMFGVFYEDNKFKYKI